MKRHKKVFQVIYITLSSIVLIYIVFVIVINQTITAQIDIETLADTTQSVIAYNTPASDTATDKEIVSEDILELGKNPGLNVRELHNRGITGKGVGVAIIDQNLLAGHEQYADRLRVYELCRAKGKSASRHGTAVAGIAAGKDTGVAPGADLYFISNTFGYMAPPFFLENYKYLEECIDRILDMNTYLNDNEKIRVISISRGFSDNDHGAEELKTAVNRAKEAGVFVITVSTDITFGFNLLGLEREPTADPDKLSSYTAAQFWADNLFKLPYLYEDNDNLLLVPVDSRTIAAATGETDYSYVQSGGASWAVPWLAGMYALCVQVYPEITPELFISVALETGDSITIDGIDYKLKTVINPIRIIDKLEDISSI
jgi:subtilisin family serine protease